MACYQIKSPETSVASGLFIADTSMLLDFNRRGLAPGKIIDITDFLIYLQAIIFTENPMFNNKTITVYQENITFYYEYVGNVFEDFSVLGNATSVSFLQI